MEVSGKGIVARAVRPSLRNDAFAMALFITQVYVALEFLLKKRDGFVKFVIGIPSVHKCRTVVGEMGAMTV